MSTRLSLEQQRLVIKRAVEDDISKAARLYKIDRGTVKRLIENRATIMAPPLKFQLLPGENLKTLTDQRKLELILYTEQNGQKRTWQELNVSRSTIQRLVHQRAEITQRVNALLVHRYNHHDYNI